MTKLNVTEKFLLILAVQWVAAALVNQIRRA
jgi:hypothetical protein